MKSKMVILVLIIAFVALFSGCVDPKTETFAVNEKVSVFKIFFDYNSGYEYKIFYYTGVDNKIDNIRIEEPYVTIYDSNKNLLIYVGDNKWRLYINQSTPIDGVHTRYMAGKIMVEKDIIEIPLENP